MDVKNVIRWIGVVVLPLPAYLVLQMLATVMARVLSAITADVAQEHRGRILVFACCSRTRLSGRLPVGGPVPT